MSTTIAREALEAAVEAQEPIRVCAKRSNRR